MRGGGDRIGLLSSMASTLLVWFSGIANGLRACILSMLEPTTREVEGVDALVGDRLMKLANDDVLNMRFIKTDLYAKSRKTASGIGGSVPVDS